MGQCVCVMGFLTEPTSAHVHAVARASDCQPNLPRLAGSGPTNGAPGARSPSAFPRTTAAGAVCL
eukprot:12796508-Alexandrium_andersonii.AAC.1